MVTLDTVNERLALCDPIRVWNRATQREKSRTAVPPEIRDSQGGGHDVLTLFTRFVGLSSELSFE